MDKKTIILLVLYFLKFYISSLYFVGEKIFCQTLPRIYHSHKEPDVFGTLVPLEKKKWGAGAAWEKKWGARAVWKRMKKNIYSESYDSRF